MVEDRRRNAEARKWLKTPRQVNTYCGRGMIQDDPPEADRLRVGCLTMCGRFVQRPSNEVKSCSKTWKRTVN